MVKRGYAVYVPESFGVGERAVDVDWLGKRPTLILGQYGIYTGELLARIFVADLLQVAEYMRGEEQVDPQRIVTFGISRGALLALWVAALDTRIAGAVVASGLGDGDSYRVTNFDQVLVPGEGMYFNRSDLAGCVAPRPLMIAYGTKRIGRFAETPTYLVEGTRLTAARRARQIYAFAQADEAITVCVHPGGHTWDEEATFAFLQGVFGQ